MEKFMKIREIVDRMICKTGVTPLPPEKTCDKLMVGDFDREVSKIAVTFMATVDVIKKAAAMGVDLIITHEPTWFTGEDSTEWLEGDPVYLKKKELIEQTGVAIWRFHDHMHMDAVDGIMRGFDEEVGWGKYRMKPDVDLLGGKGDFCYQIPKTDLRGLCAFFKEKLSMDVIQIIGDPEMKVERVGVLPGGGSLGIFSEYHPMQIMRNRELDVIVCGEILEWRLPAYVRDAFQLGISKAILVLGHERSEEPGMKHLVEWMSDVTGEIPVVFIDSEEPFTYL
jgi:putative NIF3 family GTP cyclohydrolase 1 type 2